MSKLLSEQELRDKITWIGGRYQGHGDPMAFQKEMLDLIHSQKLAHANRVIGRDSRKAQRAYLTAGDFTAVVEEKAQNQLRAEQRERNK